MKSKNKAVSKYLSNVNISDFSVEKSKKSKKTSKNRNKIVDTEPAVQYISESEQKVASNKKRRIFKSLIIVIAFLIALASGVVLSLTTFFQIQKIDVECSVRYNRDDIIKQSGIKYGENLFLCNRSAAAESIKSKNPYIENIDVRIKIPDKINIVITDAVPSYYILFNNKYFALSKGNRILEVNDNKTFNIPIIEGIKLDSLDIGEYVEIDDKNLKKVLKEILVSLEKHNMDNIIGIDISSLFAINFNYQNRIKVNMGSADSIDYKIRTAKKIIFDELDGAVKGVLDVSLVDKEGKQSSFLQDNNIYSD